MFRLQICSLLVLPFDGLKRRHKKNTFAQMGIQGRKKTNRLRRCLFPPSDNETANNVNIVFDWYKQELMVVLQV